MSEQAEDTVAAILAEGASGDMNLYSVQMCSGQAGGKRFQASVFLGHRQFSGFGPTPTEAVLDAVERILLLQNGNQTP